MFRKPIGISFVVFVCLISVISLFAFSKSNKNEKSTNWNTRAQAEQIDYTVKKGDSLSAIFVKEDLKASTLDTVANLPLVFNDLKPLQPNEKIDFIFNSQHQLKELILPFGASGSMIVTDHQGHYKTIIRNNNTLTKTITITNFIHSSIDATMHRLGVPSHITRQFVKVFSNEFDLAKVIKNGDQFSITYAATFKSHKLIKTKLLLASLTLKHHKYTALLDAGEYYQPDGINWQKAFLRVPVKYVYISSPFSLHRYHPILHYYRPHEGVDLAADKGTPVHASSNGVIKFAGKEHGYGNVIILQYNKEYSTRYAHLYHFAKGIHRGVHVKKGQVIGYVGMTGLATGPHLHYEFREYGKAVNPMTVKLPHGPNLYGYAKRKLETYADNLDLSRK